MGFVEEGIDLYIPEMIIVIGLCEGYLLRVAGLLQKVSISVSFQLLKTIQDEFERLYSTHEMYLCVKELLVKAPIDPASTSMLVGQTQVELDPNEEVVGHLPTSVSDKLDNIVLQLIDAKIKTSNIMDMSLIGYLFDDSESIAKLETELHISK